MSHILLAELEPKDFFFGESKAVEFWLTQEANREMDSRYRGHVLAREYYLATNMNNFWYANNVNEHKMVLSERC